LAALRPAPPPQRCPVQAEPGRSWVSPVEPVIEPPVRPAPSKVVDRGQHRATLGDGGPSHRMPGPSAGCDSTAGRRRNWSRRSTECRIYVACSLIIPHAMRVSVVAHADDASIRGHDRTRGQRRIRYGSRAGVRRTMAKSRPHPRAANARNLESPHSPPASGMIEMGSPCR
jgi:hypothetical protein